MICLEPARQKVPASDRVTFFSHPAPSLFFHGTVHRQARQLLDSVIPLLNSYSIEYKSNNFCENTNADVLMC
jgi:hypothetical protein